MEILNLNQKPTNPTIQLVKKCALKIVVGLTDWMAGWSLVVGIFKIYSHNNQESKVEVLKDQIKKTKIQQYTKIRNRVREPLNIQTIVRRVQVVWRVWDIFSWVFVFFRFIHEYIFRYRFSSLLFFGFYVVVAVA